VKIAKAAKDDSSAMRTLAFMSIIFLPGTFIAVSFQLCLSYALQTSIEANELVFLFYEHV
jgi:hypothetical protein